MIRSVNRILLAMAMGVSAISVWAGDIVPEFDDSMAIADYSYAHNGAIDDTVDITSGLITLAARFSPASTMATGGPYIIIEIGGTSNGTGLYLADGNIVLAAKANSARLGVPSSMNDTDYSDSVLAVTLGAVAIDSENEVYISFNDHTGELYCNINGEFTSYSISGVTGVENIDGNHSVSFLGNGAITDYGFMGGLLEAGAAEFPLLFWTNASSMVQSAGYTGQRGQVFASVVNDPNAEYEIRVVQSENVTRVQEGGYTDTIGLSITDNPGAYSVTISLTDKLDPDQIEFEPSEVVFNSGNWQQVQNVAVTAIDDADMERAEHDTMIGFEVEVSSESEYSGQVLTDIMAYIVENDCGAYGFNPADLNLDCQVDLEDFALFVQEWIACSNVVTECQGFEY